MLRLLSADSAVFFIEFCAGGDSTGVYFPDPLDDYCAKLILAGAKGGIDTNLR